MDLRTETPRDATLPYLPAEPYPYAPPYTAEEMGMRSTEFAHMPRRNCALVEDYGTISANGYLTTAQSIGLVLYRDPAGLVGQLRPSRGSGIPSGCSKRLRRRSGTGGNPSTLSTVPTSSSVPSSTSSRTRRSCAGYAANRNPAARTKNPGLPLPLIIS